MDGRHTRDLLENMRQMIRRHGHRLSNILECQLLGEMRADVLPDTVRQHQIMRLIGGARIRRQIGRQEHQRRQQLCDDFIRVGRSPFCMLVNQFAERLHVVNLVHRRTHKSVFCLGEMPFRQSAQLQTGNAKAERTDLVLQGRGDFMQIALII